MTSDVSGSSGHGMTRGACAMSDTPTARRITVNARNDPRTSPGSGSDAAPPSRLALAKARC